MQDIIAQGPNADQIEFWNGPAGDEWAEKNAQLDEMLRPIGEAALKVANPKIGEKVLDIGCGCGDTSLALLSAVGASGEILGLDISKAMLDHATVRRDSLQLDAAQSLTFKLADAATHNFEKGEFDLVFSRFGVMFFTNPAAAFANIRTALKPTGRLTFVCWAPAAENTWVSIPLGAAKTVLPATEAPDPRAPGPFAFADQNYTKALLKEAGFSNVSMQRSHHPIKIAEGRSPAESAGFFLDVGPVSRALAEQPEVIRDTARDAIQEAIAPYHDGQAVNFKGTCWIVVANNS